MSAYHLKISKIKSVELIQKQLKKGLSIAEKGLEMIKEQSDYAMKRNQADIIKVEYEQWEEITYDKLKEIFVSSTYPYNFREHRSSKIKYVDSSWQPDVQYYIEKELIPKISYLKILLKNVEDFEEIAEKIEPKEQTQINTSDVKINSAQTTNDKSNYDFDKITFPQLLKILSIPQLIKIISGIFILLSGTFFLGQSFSNWLLEKENKSLIEENTKITNENRTLKNQVDSVKLMVKTSSDSLKNDSLPNKQINRTP